MKRVWNRGRNGLKGESETEISESVWLLSRTAGNARRAPDGNLSHLPRHYVVDDALTPLIRNTQRRNYRDCHAGDLQRRADSIDFSSRPSYEPRARVNFRKVVTSLSQRLKKKKEKKVVSAVGKKLSAHEARILLWKYTERYFRVGADFRKFRKHDKTPGGVVILGKWLSRVCYVPIAITSTPPCHYRIITASSIKPFHRVNGHEPLDIDV